MFKRIDVIYLGQPTCPLLPELVILFSRLPKFALSTPVPYNKQQLHKLHKENLRFIDNFLCSHQLGVPNQISDFFRKTSNYKLPDEELTFSLTKSSPWHRLKTYLMSHDLILTPADKTHHLVVWPFSTYLHEFHSHLSDEETYHHISSEEVNRIDMKMIQLVRDASTYFTENSIIVSNPKPRYFFLLPKLHKPLCSWRIPFLHPKCRPIISDACSSTVKLSKKLLSFTQRLENTLLTVASSSLEITSHMEFNATFSSHFDHYIIPNQPSNLLCATCDVESLFTKIPLDQLLNILREHLPHVCKSSLECSRILEFLQGIIDNNIFQAGNQFFHQKIGLPMGGSLSPSLANIYLGVLERKIISQYSPPILFYRRYMDDLLFILINNPPFIDTFLSILRNIFQLSITSSSSPAFVTFLDTRLHVYPTRFTITFYSKLNAFFRIPLSSDKRSAHRNINLLNSQLLRMWRLSLDDKVFSSQILELKDLFINSGIRHLLTSSMFKFLKPVQISHTNWSTSHLLCPQCLLICEFSKIIIRKIFSHFNIIIASKFPISCKSSDIIFFIFQPPLNAYHLTDPTSLHVLLSTELPLFLQILPFSNKVISSNSDLLKKLPIISSFPSPDVPREIHLYLHPTVPNFQKTYGVQAKTKKRRSVANYFNFYKHVKSLSLTPPPPSLT
jgi:hypothetical protein